MPQVNRELNPDPSRFKGNDHPVEKVSWYDAVEFCIRLSRYTDKSYRLPSEAEWEYACRADTTTPFHFGETITTDLANYNGNDTYGDGSKGVNRQETTSVGSFGVANAFGLYDMHGNVWEWCTDDWHDNYEGAPEDGSALIDDNNNHSQKNRVLRGGSWYSLPVGCRSAYRLDLNAGVHFYINGFRVVCAGKSTILWVDDNPHNNLHERRSLEALGISFVLATSTKEALDKLKRQYFNLIISDMGRPPDSQAGYTLLDQLRSTGDDTPFIIYAGSKTPQYVAESQRRGAVGCTNNPSELCEMVLSSLGRRA